MLQPTPGTVLKFLLLMGVAPCMSATAEVLPVEAFASLPQVQTARVSPNGKHLAMQFNVEGLSHIATLAIGAGEKPKSILSTDNKEFRINWFTWVNDDRLFISMRYPSRILASRSLMEHELYSVNRDGSDLRVLLDTRRAKWVPQFRDRVIDYLPDDPDHVLMELDMQTANLRDVFRVDVVTGSRNRVQRGRKNVTRWFTDRQHRIRGLVRNVAGTESVEISDPDGEHWRTIWEHPYYSTERVIPMGFDYDPNVLYVEAYQEGRLAVFRVNLEDPELTRELVYSDPHYDVEGGLVYSLKSKKVLGIGSARDDDTYIIWDKEYAAIFSEIEAALPDTKNSLVNISRDENRYVLFASSTTRPGTLYLGDRAKRQLVSFAERYPQLKDVPLAGKLPVHYPSKDGLSIDGYLTLPVTRREGQKLPAIVFPHGGPAARTITTFDYWTEFFANRGYAVLEMDFRGSSGQGFEWMASAFARWDQITQQDIADGARYLVSEGIADPKRICIVGASFGGYAALTGAIKYPDLYKCAISIAGVSDLVELRNRSRGFLHSEEMEAQIGHDSDRLREASPIHQAEAITQPVLLIHGKTDRVVEVGQSQAMYAELKRVDKPVQYVELETGDHHLSNYFDRVATFKAIDEFLKRNL